MEGRATNIALPSIRIWKVGCRIIKTVLLMLQPHVERPFFANILQSPVPQIAEVLQHTQLWQRHELYSFTMALLWLTNNGFGVQSVGPGRLCFFLHPLCCLAVCLLCFYFVTYCAQIMHKIIIIERHTTTIIERHTTTTILIVCYTNWLCHNQLEITQMSQIRRSDESDQTLGWVRSDAQMSQIRRSDESDQMLRWIRCSDESDQTLRWVRSDAQMSQIRRSDHWVDSEIMNLWFMNNMTYNAQCFERPIVLKAVPA